MSSCNIIIDQQINNKSHSREEYEYMHNQDKIVTYMVNKKYSKKTSVKHQQRLLKLQHLTNTCIGKMRRFNIILIQ